MATYNICPNCDHKWKVCPKCDYPYDGDLTQHFGADSSTKDGLKVWCKTCRELHKPEGQSMHKLTDDVKSAYVGKPGHQSIQVGEIMNKSSRRRAAKHVHKARGKQAKADALRKVERRKK